MPNLAKVIPTMNIIDDHLTAKDTYIFPAICSALRLSKKTLNCYYSRASDSAAYQIAMSMFLFFCLLLLVNFMASPVDPTVNKNSSTLGMPNGRTSGLVRTQFDRYYCKVGLRNEKNKGIK